jgi:histidinol-phosphate aminotransferase
MCFANSIFIDYFNKIKPPYNVNSLTQDRALKLLESPEKINNGINEILEERKKIEKQLMKFKFIKKIFPSDANFLLIMVDNAEKRYDQFLSKGVVLRNRSHLIGCENTLRVTIGTPKENNKFINICKEIDV